MNPTDVSTAYSGRTTNWPMLALTAVLAAPLVALGALSERSASGLVVPVGLVLVMLVVNGITATSLRASAGPRGVIVRFGVLGWPRFAYPLDRIERADATQISPLSFFAWGISWLPGSGLRLAMGPGPALRLTLTGGRRVTVSVPDPDAAIATLALAQADRAAPR